MKRSLLSLFGVLSLTAIAFSAQPAAAFSLPDFPSLYMAADCVKLSVPLINGVDCIPKDAPGGVIFAYVRQLIQLLSAAVGLVVTLMLVIGGFQYITSVGDPGAVRNAKNRITNAVTGFILFLLMFAILNYLIPGGIIG